MKKIAVFTSARSEYGPLKPLLQAFKQDGTFQLELLVGGGHLSTEQGMTINEIHADGMAIAATFPFLIHDPSNAMVSRSNGLLQLQISDYFANNAIDLLLVLGDRSELIPVVSSALLQSIPVAHLSGGEVTEGATDNQIRHAVTKMSHVHFPATETYKDNLVRMGEEEWRICVSGEPSLDGVLTIQLPDKSAFCEQYGLSETAPLLLGTIHSETINQSIDAVFIEQLIDQLTSETPYQLLFTAANTDQGGIIINETLERLAQTNDRLTFVRSLGKTNYYAALSNALVVIGNSSSGIIEAQNYAVPVVNIGSRQDGRLRNVNVHDVPVSVSAILEGIHYATGNEFEHVYKGQPNIYGDGHASKRIVAFLKNLDWDALLLKRSTF